MAQTGLSNLGINYEHTLGIDDWKNSYDANWVTLDTLAQGYVIDHLITAEPGAPSVGDAYVLGSSQTGTNWGSDAGAVPNAIALYTNIPGQLDSSPWLYLTPREGWAVYDRTNNVWLEFDGTNWQGATTARVRVIGDNSGDFTPSLSDGNQVLDISDAFDEVGDNFIIPTNANVAYKIGTTLEVINQAGAALNLTTTGLTFVGTTPITIADNAFLKVRKIATDTWIDIT